MLELRLLNDDCRSVFGLDNDERPPYQEIIL